MQPHGTCDTGGDSDAMKPLDSTAHRGRPGRGRLRSLAARGLAGLLAAIVALPLQA